MNPQRIDTTPAPTVRHTGAGPMPGTDVREAAAMIVGECPDLPVLPSLPERGLGADRDGRTTALLVGLPVDVSTRGWRIGVTTGRAGRRAADLLDRDVDAMEEAWERARGTVTDDPAGADCEAVTTGGADGADHGRRLQVRVTGPWTLAARVEQPGGRCMLADTGARRDLAESLAEGLSAASVRLADRLGMRARVVLDEPDLWAVVAGAVPGPSHFDPVAAVAAPRVSTALCRFADALRDRGVAEVLVSIPGRPGRDLPVPWSVLVEPARGETPLDGLVIDAGDLISRSGDGGEGSDRDAPPDRRAVATLDAVGSTLGEGRIVQIEGVHRWSGLTSAPRDDEQVERTCAGVLELLDRLAAPRWTTLDRLVLAPTGAETAASPVRARAALTAVRRIAEELPRIAQ